MLLDKKECRSFPFPVEVAFSQIIEIYIDSFGTKSAAVQVTNGNGKFLYLLMYFDRLLKQSTSKHPIPGPDDRHA